MLFFVLFFFSKSFSGGVLRPFFSQCTIVLHLKCVSDQICYRSSIVLSDQRIKLPRCDSGLNPDSCVAVSDSDLFRNRVLQWINDGVGARRCR
jgi:hypothetical protein